MSVCKRKDGRWQVTFRDGPKVRSRTFPPGREGKKKAKAFDADVKHKKAIEQPLPIAHRNTIYLDELAQLWIDEKKAQGRQVEWLQSWASVLNKVFLPHLGRKPVKYIHQHDVLQIITAYYSNASQSTRNRYMGYLKSIFEHGVQQGHLKRNPLAFWKKGKEQRRHSPLTLEALIKLKSQAPPHLAWALEVAWNIPVRPGPSDLFALRFDQHLNVKRSGFEVLHSKVGRKAFIVCDNSFIESVIQKESYHDSGHIIEYNGKPLKSLKKALSTAATKAKLGYSVCMYDIRHLWITTMLDKGLEPSAIAYLAGTSVKMIHTNYYEPHAAERHRAASLLPTI